MRRTLDRVTTRRRPRTAPHHGVDHGRAAAARLTHRCAAIATSPAFDVAIAAVILANAAALGIETYGANELTDTLNDAFLATFVVEIAIRLGAHGQRPRAFLASRWNVFDLIVVTAAFLPGVRENATLLRLARLARVTRLVQLLPDLRLLVVTVIRSLPGVASLAVMAVLLLYLYGMVGWLLFADQRPQDYGSIGDAMLTLFVLLSLENLPSQMQQGLQVTAWAIPYYVSFVVLASLLLLNLVIAVVINSLEQAREIEWRRRQHQRRADAAETPHPDDDRDVAIADRLHAMRKNLEALEREIYADRRTQP